MFTRPTNGRASTLQPFDSEVLFDTVFGNPRKLMLLAGPPGCGKTTLVRVLARHCKYTVVEINASDDRSATNLIRKIEDIANNDTLRGNNQPSLICLDEIDGVVEGEANGITKILDFL
jgi:chromosome transmission fidelity protein 18